MTRPHNEPMPCGTRAAYKRGCRCEPCTQASREYEATIRLKAGMTPRTQMNTQEVIAEIEYLLMCGEGEHRILQATGYVGKENSLKSRLWRAGRNDLFNQIFTQRELAA